MVSSAALVATPTTRRKKRRSMFTVRTAIMTTALVRERKTLISVTSTLKRSLPSEQVLLNDQIV